MDSQRLDIYVAAWEGRCPNQGEPLRQRVLGCARTGRGVTVRLLPGEEQGDPLEGWLPFAWGKCVLSSGAIKELGYESVARLPFFFFIFT